MEQEIDKLRGETEGLAKRMVENAEGENVQGSSRKFERLEKDRERLSVEELLECVIKNSLKHL